MREIKFNFIYGIDGEIETYFTKTFTFGEIENGCHFNEICDSPLLKGYSILGKRQYTGLKDKNGQDIYEGDIINVYDWGGDHKLLGVATVEWNQDDIGWRHYPYYGAEDAYDQFRNVEKIGNIYENPDLLS